MAGVPFDGAGNHSGYEPTASHVVNVGSFMAFPAHQAERFLAHRSCKRSEHFVHVLCMFAGGTSLVPGFCGDAECIRAVQVCAGMVDAGFFKLCTLCGVSISGAGRFAMDRVFGSGCGDVVGIPAKRWGFRACSGFFHLI